ncbi:MAG: vitamin B12 dependent-methionine synthase activation domain-containing protein [Dehalococcoidales bacterium]|nr:vitamin B12 dependent-methionine synthase activation domain-containing protein [Dehalococcoidales bacterium]
MKGVAGKVTSFGFVMKILSDIPVRLDAGRVLERISMRGRRPDMLNSMRELTAAVLPIASPKVVYRVSYVDNRTEDSLEVDGVRFTSRVLRDSLDKVGRVFPFVATCGRELDEIDVPADDLIRCYYLDQIKETVLEVAVRYLEEHLISRYELGPISEIEPGSVESWPITQQKELFSILGNVEDAIGVRLTDDFLMVPLKSISGICFSAETRFESCRLCSRERCTWRKAPCDPDLAGKYTAD